MIMRSLSIRTHLFTLSVVACTLFLCVGFFLEPNTDYFETSTSVTKEMAIVASSDLHIDYEVKTLTKDGFSSENVDVVETYTDETTDVDSVDGYVEDSDYSDISNISYDEYSELCKLVQAEANSEDIFGRTMVANVVLNRVRSNHYDNDILSVIYDSGQFEPVSRGIMNRVDVTHETKEAVMYALHNEDLTDGALYFQKSKSHDWGDKEYLYRYGAHSFYK